MPILYRRYCYLANGCDAQGTYQGIEPTNLPFDESVGENIAEHKTWRNVRSVLSLIETDERMRKMLEVKNWGTPYQRWIMDNTARSLVGNGASREGELQAARAVENKGDGLAFLREGHPHYPYYRARRRRQTQGDQCRSRETREARRQGDTLPLS